METVEIINRKESSYSEKPNNSDTISRQAAIDVANKLIDRFERILRDIRETNEDESVCGMCEYDGAFIGESGDWCNECPGFNRADCFKLSEECRKRWLKELNLPSAQPDENKYEYHYDHTDCIWYRPEARNRCPVTCAQYRDGWNDAMNYIFRDGKGYKPYRRDKQYGE